MSLCALALHQSLETQMLLNTCVPLREKYCAVLVDKAPVTVDQVFHLWLKFQMNTKQTYDCLGCICRVDK
jgi:hypothetical protein